MVLIGKLVVKYFGFALTWVRKDCYFAAFQPQQTPIVLDVRCSVTMRFPDCVFPRPFAEFSRNRLRLELFVERKIEGFRR